MELKPIPEHEKDLLRRGFFHDHQKELSAIDGIKPGNDGLYPYPYYDLYWTETSRRFPFWVMRDGERAGFVFLRMIKKEESPISIQTLQLSEFYLKPGARGAGLAQEVMDDLASRARKLSKPLTWTCYSANTAGNNCYKKALKRLSILGFRTRSGKFQRRNIKVDEILYLVVPPELKMDFNMP